MNSFTATHKTFVLRGDFWDAATPTTITHQNKRQQQDCLILDNIPLYPCSTSHTFSPRAVPGNSNAIKFPLCQNARCDVTTLVVMIQAQWTRVCVEKLLA